jgi:hypothetical protein
MPKYFSRIVVVVTVLTLLIDPGIAAAVKPCPCPVIGHTQQVVCPYFSTQALSLFPAASMHLPLHPVASTVAGMTTATARQLGVDETIQEFRRARTAEESETALNSLRSKLRERVPDLEMTYWERLAAPFQAWGRAVLGQVKPVDIDETMKTLLGHEEVQQARRDFIRAHDGLLSHRSRWVFAESDLDAFTDLVSGVEQLAEESAQEFTQSFVQHIVQELEDRRISSTELAALREEEITLIIEAATQGAFGAVRTVHALHMTVFCAALVKSLDRYASDRFFEGAAAFLQEARSQGDPVQTINEWLAVRRLPIPLEIAESDRVRFSAWLAADPENAARFAEYLRDTETQMIEVKQRLTDQTLASPYGLFDHRLGKVVVHLGPLDGRVRCEIVSANHAMANHLWSSDLSQMDRVGEGEDLEAASKTILLHLEFVPGRSGRDLLPLEKMAVYRQTDEDALVCVLAHAMGVQFFEANRQVFEDWDLRQEGQMSSGLTPHDRRAALREGVALSVVHSLLGTQGLVRYFQFAEYADPNLLTNRSWMAYFGAVWLHEILVYQHLDRWRAKVDPDQEILDRTNPWRLPSKTLDAFRRHFGELFYDHMFMRFPRMRWNWALRPFNTKTRAPLEVGEEDRILDWSDDDGYLATRYAIMREPSVAVVAEWNDQLLKQMDGKRVTVIESGRPPGGKRFTRLYSIGRIPLAGPALLNGLFAFGALLDSANPENNAFHIKPLGSFDRQEALFWMAAIAEIHGYELTVLNECTEIGGILFRIRPLRPEKPKSGEALPDKERWRVAHIRQALSDRRDDLEAEYPSGVSAIMYKPWASSMGDTYIYGNEKWPHQIDKILITQEAGQSEVHGYDSRGARISVDKVLRHWGVPDDSRREVRVLVTVDWGVRRTCAVAQSVALRLQVLVDRSIQTALEVARQIRQKTEVRQTVTRQVNHWVLNQNEIRLWASKRGESIYAAALAVASLLLILIYPHLPSSSIWRIADVVGACLLAALVPFAGYLAIVFPAIEIAVTQDRITTHGPGTDLLRSGGRRFALRAVDAEEWFHRNLPSWITVWLQEFIAKTGGVAWAIIGRNSPEFASPATVTRPAPLVFDHIDQLIRWVKTHVGDNEEVLLMPHFTATHINRFRKARLIDFLENEELDPYISRFLRKNRFAAVSTVLQNGHRQRVILISEAGKKAVSESKGVREVFHYIHGAYQREMAESIQKHGFFVIPGRGMFFLTPKEIPGQELIKISIPNRELMNVATNSHDIVGLAMDKRWMGARLPEELKRFLEWHSRLDAGRVGERLRTLLLADAAGFLVRIPPSDMKFKTTSQVNSRWTPPSLRKSG